MENNHVHPTIQKIINLTNQNPANCYQCGKCSAGCPVRDYFDDSPNRVIRFIQLGLYDRALKSKAIWLCAGCQTCSSRCPYRCTSYKRRLQSLVQIFHFPLKHLSKRIYLSEYLIILKS